MTKKWKILQQMEKNMAIVLIIEVTECSNIIDKYRPRSERFEKIFTTWY
jgi:hypothetical protein